MKAVKADGGKDPWDLLPYDAVGAVLDVVHFGANKYGSRNWESGMTWSRVFAAIMRHLIAWFRGEDSDRESGMPHLAHAACGILFLIAYAHRGVGTDDRPAGWGVGAAVKDPKGGPDHGV